MIGINTVSSFSWGLVAVFTKHCNFFLTNCSEFCHFQQLVYLNRISIWKQTFRGSFQFNVYDTTSKLFLHVLMHWSQCEQYNAKDIIPPSRLFLFYLCIIPTLSDYGPKFIFKLVFPVLYNWFFIVLYWLKTLSTFVLLIICV